MINGKVYIGQAIDVIARFKGHIKGSKTAKDGIDAAIRKYGAENFTVVTICGCYDHKDLDDMEKHFIAVYRQFYGRKGCYNIADGGQGGALFKGKKHTEEAKKKISDATKGEKHPWYGKRHTEASKKKMSDAQKGKHHTEETKKKMSDAQKGKKRPDHSEKMKGEKNPMYCKHHTEEAKKKNSDAHKGKHHTEIAKKKMSDLRKGEKNPKAQQVNQYNIEGNFIREWEYIGKAAKELRIAHSSISMCCNGKRKSAGGFIWRYKKEETLNGLLLSTIKY